MDTFNQVHTGDNLFFYSPTDEVPTIFDDEVVEIQAPEPDYNQRHIYTQKGFCIIEDEGVLSNSAWVNSGKWVVATSREALRAGLQVMLNSIKRTLKEL